MKLLKIILLMALVIPQVSCGKKKKSDANDIQETAQQVGDVMASIDEAGGSSGTIAMLEDSHSRFFARYGDSLQSSSFVPSANATLCMFASTFSGCSSGTITRDFGGCTIGIGTFTGTVTLHWGNGSACALNSVGDTITRVPAFTATGIRGGSLTVSKTGAIGQRLTWTGGTGANKTFDFTNDGIKRVIAFNGATLFDFTTQTLSPIHISGTSRANRVVNGGTLRVSHNIANVNCDYVPTNVTWSANCNCPVSGSWTTTCSNGKSSTISLTGCGTANFTMGDDTQAVTFDRCYGF